MKNIQNFPLDINKESETRVIHSTKKRKKNKRKDNEERSRKNIQGNTKNINGKKRERESEKVDNIEQLTKPT